MSRLERAPRVFAELGSTNTHCKDHLADLPDGAAVLALRQTAGRGRRGKSWADTADSGMALSFVLKGIELRQVAALPLCVGLAVSEALEEAAGCRAEIKWPNDLVVGGKKVCGILCEGVVGEETAAVCGIGVNLTQTAEDFARRQLPHGGSLLSECGVRLAPRELAVQVLAHCDRRVEQFLAQGLPSLLPAYRARSATLERIVGVLWEGREAVGRAVDVGEDGSLLVEIDGQVVSVCSGEASVRGLYGYR